MQFVIFEDNSGSYHWTILDRGGERIAQSPSFASFHDAERAAHHVRDSAASAPLNERGADGSGSLSAEAVTT